MITYVELFTNDDENIYIIKGHPMRSNTKYFNETNQFFKKQLIALLSQVTEAKATDICNK